MLDFAVRRVRYERRYERWWASTGPVRFCDVLVRDKDRVISHSPKDQNSNAKGNSKFIEFNYDVADDLIRPHATPLLRAHGYFGRATTTRDFEEKLSDKNFEVRGIEEFDGRDCVVLRWRRGGRDNSHTDFWVDPDRDAAVARLVKGDDTVPNYLEDRVVHSPAKGVWMPVRWTQIWSSQFESPQEVITLRVVRSGEPSLDRETFWVEPQAGDYFARGRKPWLHQGPDKPPIDLDEAVKEVRKKKET